MPAARVIYILRQVCASLEEAHVRGLVHRDIKPANIQVGCLVLRSDFVKVLDFGLAKSVASPVPGSRSPPPRGVTPGTPAYMAPEMALGDASMPAPTSTRSAVSPTSCSPVPSSSRRTPVLQIIAKHLRAEPVPRRSAPTLADPGGARADRAGLSREEARRAAAQRRGLSRALAGVEGEPWNEDRARAWWTANRPGLV